MAGLGEVGVRVDPVTSHNFLISLIDTSSTLALAKSAAMSAVNDIAVGGFNECSGIEMTLELDDYEEGGRNGEVLRFPKKVKWSNITLKRGVGAFNVLWDWFYGFVEGKGHRYDGTIVLQNEMHIPNNIWLFRRGLPVKYSGPTLNAAQSNVAIESIEIAHEGIYQLPYVGLGAAASSGIAGTVT
jgi:phage tail-like protein